MKILIIGRAAFDSKSFHMNQNHFSFQLTQKFVVSKLFKLIQNYFSLPDFYETHNMSTEEPAQLPSQSALTSITCSQSLAPDTPAPTESDETDDLMLRLVDHDEAVQIMFIKYFLTSDGKTITRAFSSLLKTCAIKNSL